MTMCVSGRLLRPAVRDEILDCAAGMLCPGGRLVCGKQGEAGMTIAVARRQWMVDFEGGQDGA